jgi:hypothetical protein
VGDDRNKRRGKKINNKKREKVLLPLIFEPAGQGCYQNNFLTSAGNMSEFFDMSNNFENF